MGDLLEVGHVLKAHGVKGEIRIAFNADSPALLSGFIYLQKKTDRILPIRHNVYRRRSERGSLLLCLEGIEDRDAAEALRGMRILVPRQRLPRLPAGELYLSELPGLEVWTLGEGSPAPMYLGRLERAEEAAGQEIWHIITPGGQEVLFPAVEEFVREVDTQAGRALICPPPGLLDLYLEN